MTEADEATLRTFWDRSTPNWERKCHAQMSCVCYRVGDEWINLASRVILTPVASIVSEAPRVFVSHERLLALRFMVPPERIQQLITGITNGRIDRAILPDGCPDSIVFVSPESKKVYRIWGNNRTSTRSLNEGDHLGSFPAIELSGHGEVNIGQIIPGDVWDDFTGILSSNDPPFAGLIGLGRDLGLELNPGGSTSVNVKVISPYWVRLHSIREDLEHHNVEVRLLTRWRDDLPQVSVSLIPLSPSQSEFKRRSVVADGSWQREFENGELTVWRCILPVGNDTGPCDVFLNYENIHLESAPTGIGSARLVAHEIVDPGFEGLRRRISNTKNSDQLEEGVAWLLHLCGFSVARYGYKDVSHSVDVVAFDGELMAIFAECTTAPPDSKKIRDVRSRASAVQHRLRARHGRDLNVAAVVFVSVVDEQLVQDYAAENGVAVVGIQQMEELLRLAIQGYSTSEMYRRLEVSPSDQ